MVSLSCVGLFFMLQGASALAASPASGVANASVAKNAALQMTSTLENSTTKMQYNYAENINDGRGITFGAIGFCTGTYDGNVLVKYYTQLNANNVLAKYIPALNTIDNGAHNSAGGDGNPSVTGLGNFIKDVQGNTDPLFVTAQLYELDQLYWDPAITMANKIGAKYNLTLAFIYDMSVRQGPDGAQDIIDSATSALGGTPATGINETTYLNKLMTVRDGVLKREGLGDVDRDNGFKTVLSSGNVNLQTPYSFTAYGESFTIVNNANGITTTGSNTTATKYTLTVNGGTGDGSYEAGTKVNIVADAPASGKVFDKWTGSNVTFGSATLSSTTVTMPAAAATVTATYKSTSVTTAASSSLTVSAIPNTVTTVLKGSTDVQLIAINLANTGTEDLVLSEIAFAGSYSSRRISNLALYLGDVKVGDAIANRSSLTTFRGMTIDIAKGESVTLTLKGDVSASNRNATVTYNVVPSKMIAKNASGTKAKISAVRAKSVLKIQKTVASLSAEIASGAGVSVENGTEDAQLIAIKITNTGTEDSAINYLEILKTGSSSKVTDLKLFVDGVEIDTTAKTSYSRVYFKKLDIPIAKGESVTFVLKGDIATTGTNASVTYQIRSGLAKAKGVSGDTAKITVTKAKTVLDIQPAA